MGKRFSLDFSRDTVDTWSVVVGEDVTIIPQTEVIVPGQVEGLVQQCLGMLEPSSNLPSQYDVLVACVVGKAEKGIMPARIVNLVEDAQILKKGYNSRRIFFY